MNRGNPVVGVIFIIIGFIFLSFLFIKPALKSMDAKNWEKVACTVINSNIRAGYKGSYDINIIYTYDINGSKYTGNRYNITGDFTGETAKGISEKYPEGTKTFCYVNPKSPSEAVIERELNFNIFGMASVILIWTLFAVFITIGNLKSKKTDAKHPAIKVELIKRMAKKEKKKKKKETIKTDPPQKDDKKLSIPGIIMFIPGFIITSLLLLPLTMTLNRVKTPCVIICSEVKQDLKDSYFQINKNDMILLKNQFNDDKIKILESIKYSKFSPEELQNTLAKLNFNEEEIKKVTEKTIKNFHYIPHVLYKYDINGIEYTSSRYSLYSTSWKMHEAEELIRPYPAGNETFCYVKTANPENAYLANGIPAPLDRILILSLSLMLMGIFWIFKDKIKNINVFRKH